MSVDRLLSTLLRSLQSYTDQQDTPRLLSTIASLLTTLSNPHNLALLTSQVLTSPAIWVRPDGLQGCFRVLSTFHSAASTLLRHHNTVYIGEEKPLTLGQIPLGGGLSLDEWTRAVVKGADERSERWKHLLVLGGLLLGFENNDEERLATGAKNTLASAFVKVVNLALNERDGNDLGDQSIALVTNHAFPALSDLDRREIDYDRLLPVLIGTAFFSNEGYQSAYFLGTIDPDVIEVSGRNKFDWSAQSSSFRGVQRLLSRPLISSMGPLARLIAHTAESVQNPRLLHTMMEDLTGFSRTLAKQWRFNKLSEIDLSEEALFLTEDAMTTTLPSLWKLLKSSLFATIIVLRGVLGRALNDSALAADAAAPVVTSQTLHILRNLYFISSRMGQNAFSQYTFVSLTAMDMMAQYPVQADAFVKETKPAECGHIPKHPLDRNLDMFFLNTAEHFTLVLPAQTNEDALVAAATPYLAAGGNRHLLPIFEAAHSVMLAVLSAPQSAELTAKHLPFYVDALFMVFPTNLSPRQFRVAFRTLLRVTAPPSPLSATHPELPPILLELIHYRAVHAPTTPLTNDINSPLFDSDDTDTLLPPLSEQSVLIMTLLDALPLLPISLLEEWLPICADLINSVQEPMMRDTCRKRFWEVIIGGEMDPERSQCCVAWWSTRGGREKVLFGEDFNDATYMSGALPPPPNRDSKL